MIASVEPQGWADRAALAADVFMPWLDRVFPLEGKRVLEYGSGTGSVSTAVAERAGSLIGYDIDEPAVALARNHAADRGLENISFVTTSAEEIFGEVRGHAGEIDVFLLYAVLEHLTTAERLEALRVARDVVASDGVIVVVETPNRLIDTDTHTSLLPFFDQLPPELALEYAERSPRELFRDEIVAARESEPDRGAMRLARWGAGASFHEFELVFGDLAGHVIAGGYDAELLGERTIHPEEVALARELDRLAPQIPAPFSRCWLDFVLSPTAVDPATVELVRPWPFETTSSPNARLTEWDTIAIDPGRPLSVTPRVATERVVCVFTAGRPAVTVAARTETATTTLETAGPPGYAVVAELALDEPAGTFELEFSEAVHVRFVGCAEPGARGAAVA